jgi:solute carrier family 35 protein F5
VTFVNSACFLIPLLPILLSEYRKDPHQFQEVWDAVRATTSRYTRLEDAPDDAEEAATPSPPSSSTTDDDPKPHRATSALPPISSSSSSPLPSSPARPASPIPGTDKAARLTLLQTARLSLEFSALWFAANYFAAACLEYTTVGSATILTSTSSVWTLLFGAIAGVERFSVRKLLGVAASLAGLALVSGLDVAGSGGGGGGPGDDSVGGSGGMGGVGGSFPHKTARELAVGDALALIGAVIYGVYAVVLKKRIGSESRANLPLFFGLVGLFNALAMWPAFLFLHVTGVEPFELPPSRRVLTIILINSTSSMVSDFCWAAAMLLTSPLLVTVGLSLTIPLSLVGQMFISGVYADWAYWAGALVVLCSFVFINHEETRDEEEAERSRQSAGASF